MQCYKDEDMGIKSTRQKPVKWTKYKLNLIKCQVQLSDTNEF